MRVVRFFFNVTTQLALQVQQERTQVVCSNKEAQKRMTKSNGTSAMDLGHDCFDMMHLYIGRGFGKWNGMVSIMIIIIILLCCVLVFFSILSFPPLFLFLFLLLECIKCVCG